MDTILSSTTRLVTNKAAWENPQKRRKIEDVALLLKVYLWSMFQRSSKHCWQSVGT